MLYRVLSVGIYFFEFMQKALYKTGCGRDKNLFSRLRFKSLSRKAGAPGKKGPLWAVALMVSALAGLSVYYALVGVYQPVNVVVAARDLQPMQKIGPSDVRLQAIARRDYHPKMIASLDSVVGTYTGMPLAGGETLLSTKVIRSPGNMVEAYGALKPNETLIVLKSGQVSWPDVISDGDIVSAVAVYSDKNSDRALDVAGNIKVVSSNRPLPLLEDLKSARDAQARPTSEITLLLDREDAKKLLYAAVNAKSVSLLPDNPGGPEG